jgi:hypothetical protein
MLHTSAFVALVVCIGVTIRLVVAALLCGIALCRGQKVSSITLSNSGAVHVRFVEDERRRA